MSRNDEHMQRKKSDLPMDITESCMTCDLSSLWNPDLELLFQRPARTGVSSAWYGHVPFAAWIMPVLRPRVFVELGTHNGVSYSAFCQAALRASLDLRCYAVDNWKGDEHSTLYGEEVYEDFRRFHDARYGGFSELLRCAFDDALAYISDGSVDLLHIDGFHTYEAVSHDFTSWFPKLSDRAVVLFHDINVRERGFGVWKMWAEIRESYPSFSFWHEHGLGVLAVGTQVPDGILGLCSLRDPEQIFAVRERFAIIGERWMAAQQIEEIRLTCVETQKQAERLKLDLADEVRARSEANKSLDALRLELEEAVQGQRELQAKNLSAEETILAQSHWAAEQEGRIAQLALDVANRDEQILGSRDVLGREQKRNAELEIELASRGRQILGLQDELGSEIKRVAQLTLEVAGRDRQILGLQDELGSKEKRVAQLTLEVASRDRQILGLQDELGSKEKRVAQLTLKVAGRDRQILGLQDELGSKEKRGAQLTLEVAGRDRQILGLQDELRRKDQKIDEILSSKDALVAASEERNSNLSALIENLRRELNGANHKMNSSAWRLAAPIWDIETHHPKVATALFGPLKLLYWLLTFQLIGRLRRRNVSRLLIRTGMFDAEFYLTQYPDVAASGYNPLAHYLTVGFREGRKPNPYFDTSYYLSKNPDVAASSVNPLVHYLIDGFREGREPSAEFSGALYLEDNTDVRESGMNPLSHYLLSGKAEGRAFPSSSPDSSAPSHIVVKGVADGSVASESSVNLAIVDDPCRRAQTIMQARDSSLHVLVIDCAVPTPDKDSGSVRMLGIMQALATLEFRVTFGSNLMQNSITDIERLRDVAPDILIGHHAIRDHLETRGGRYSVVILSRPEIAPRYLALVRAYSGAATLIYDTVDLHWVRFQRGSQLTTDTKLRQRAEEYFILEKLCCTSADLVWAVTDIERDTICRTWPTAHVHVVPNVHSIKLSSQPWASRKDLVFIGGYDHQPNVDAVIWFVNEILPLIHKQLPDLHFTILGSNPPQAVNSLGGTNINVLGWVPDPEPFFAQSRVFVAPLRYGAGMKGKIGQAMSLGLPVVTTSVGAEGMRLTNEVHACIASTPRDFANAVIKLYLDSDLWIRIQSNAAAHIEVNFSQAAMRRVLRDMFIDVPLLRAGNLVFE